MSKKAYKAEWRGIVGIVAAETRGKARGVVKTSGDDSGYNPDWREIRVIRAPQFDKWAATAPAHVSCITEDLAEKLCQA